MSAQISPEMVHVLDLRKPEMFENGFLKDQQLFLIAGSPSSDRIPFFIGVYFIVCFSHAEISRSASKVCFSPRIRIKYLRTVCGDLVKDTGLKLGGEVELIHGG